MTLLLLAAEMSAAEFDWIKGALLGIPTLASVFTAWLVLTGRGQRVVVTPNPLEVKGHTRLATWDELQQVNGRVTKLEEKLEKDTERLMEAGERRAVKLHERIEAVPGKIIAMLRDTKGLL